ncbi:MULTISPECIES: ribosome assembly RNA-binding protein YhbY [Vitreoscilla]|uniref:Ribosome assembly RNA-binding protein YhbY n=1 Tax=Vitreoscilla stercoraria TaxID=61 RepID=A0ABY4EBA9_VITST|nr:MULTISPECIES: ribosome assembly RNA-binding protein YhbY [Vitreoscilla]AUZ05557.1 putative RNA-binding protein YhbY [Vitreoscilla sp. C1]UOO93031.1 ribosome assembly RNA-binding protein YhbY [Vitreoscilla stercoraria]
MSKKTLSSVEKAALKQQAHTLQPVVMIGQNGLTESVVKEVDANLLAHELIKVRILGDDRDDRKLWSVQLCEQTGAELVQSIGKILVLYRQNEQ